MSLNPTLHSNGQGTNEVHKRVEWLETSVRDHLCSKVEMEALVETVVRPAMIYNLDTVSLSNRQKAELGQR